MPKPKPSKKIIKQDLMWPTPLWSSQIWEFMRSETRVTFNEDFTSWILGVKEKEKSLFKNKIKAVNKGANGTFEYTIKEGVNKGKLADSRILKNKS